VKGAWPMKLAGIWRTCLASGVAWWLAEAGFAAEPATPIQMIYVAPMSHLDFGFTAPPSAVAAKMRASAEQVLRFAAADPDYVWTFETFWQLQQWLDARPAPADLQRLIGWAQAGRLGIGAAYLTPHTGVMSAWALDQVFRLPTQWGGRHGLRLETAILNDLPGHPGDLPRFLAACGVRYLVLGVNLSFQAPLPQEIAGTPFWWEAPTGERVLCWIADRGYCEAFTGLGIHPGAARLFNRDKFGGLDDGQVLEKGIRETLQRYRKRGYRYDAILALHAFDNWGADSGSAELPRLAKQWNQGHDRLRILIGTPQAFMKHIEARHGGDLPVYRGGFGGLWESFRSGIPTANRIAGKAEAVLRAASTADLDGVRQLLVFYDHNFGMGAPGWPNMTRQEAVQHNCEQAVVVAALARIAGIAPHAAAAPQGGPQAAGAQRPQRPQGIASNALYQLTCHPMIMPPSGAEAFQPLSLQAWVGCQEQHLPGGRRLLRHWIDRRNLPAETVYVVWLFRLSAEQATAKVRNRTASGWETLPDDRLAGYDWGGWTSPFGFRLGPSEFRGDGVTTFRRVNLAGNSYLLGLCLQHGLTGTFKGGQRAVMRFEEAYPGEDPLVEVTVAVSEITAAGDRGRPDLEDPT